jgi:subtilisin family serine protease
LKKIIIISLLSSLLSAEEFYYKNGKKNILTPSKSRTIGEYIDKNNKKLIISNDVVVKFKDNNITTKYKEYLGNNIYIIETNSSKEAIEISNRLFESGDVVYAHPDMVREKRSRTLDPLYYQAWHLDNSGMNSGTIGADISVNDAWSITKGKGVNIAVYDDAVDIDHEDLSSSYINGYNFDISSTNVRPNSYGQEHGTSVAGLAVARENTLGSVGVAPESNLIVIKENYGKISTIIKAFRWADENGADVINCSWGTNDVEDSIRDVIEDLAKSGRKGKGLPIVFAVANDNADMGNDESAIPLVIGVGASTNLDKRAWYSSYGPNLDIVAPSGGGTLKLASTDMTGDLGDSKNSTGHPNYLYATDATGFNGCSGSAPIVAGVVGLMISANPDITRDQIEDIIKDTADKIGDTEYIKSRNDYYGYGRINAGKAVERAKNLRSTTSNNTNNTISLNLYKGWNLISSPISTSVAIDIIQPTLAYSFTNNDYYTPLSIEPYNGYWIYSYVDKNISITGELNINYSTLQSIISTYNNNQWYLIGTNVDIPLNQLNATKIYTYDTKNGVYKQDEIIKRGSGFWLKK